MPIDTSIQFNGHNSYRVTETVFCDPFGVEGMAYVTHSFNAYAASALGAATRARTRFFKADGTISGTTDHSFTVGVIFAEVDITVAVPALSVLCQMSFITSGTWWVAEPKSEEGQTATPYNVNYQGQLSMITPDGAYLGHLATSQIIVVGTLADPTETLDTRLVTINNNAINLSATSASHGSRLTTIEAGAITLAATDTAHGNRLTSIEAGVIVVNGSASYAAGYDPTSKETPTGAQSKANAAESNATAVANTKETPAGAQAKVNALGGSLGSLAWESLVQAARLGTTVIVGGYLVTDLIQAKAITGAKLADGTVSALQIADATISGVKIADNTITAAKINVANLTVHRIASSADASYYGEIGALSGGGIGLDLFASNVAFVSLVKLTGGGFAFYDGAGEHQRIYCQNDGSVAITGGATFQAVDAGGQIRISHSSLTTRLYSPNGLNILYVSDGGVYKQINGTVTAL